MDSAAMTLNPYRVHLCKEDFKFSAAHMTVFPDGTKESLHGHNFAVEVTLSLKETSFKEMIPFATFKAAIRKISKKWDEKLLLALRCPFLHIDHKNQEEVEFHLCRKRYVIPLEDIAFLECENISTEELSREFCSQLVAELGPNWIQHYITAIEVRVNESPGQGVTFLWQSSSG